MKPQKTTLQQVAQKLFTARLWCSYHRLLMALAILCLGSMQYARGAQTDTWNGAGADNNWGTAANWDNAVTTNGDNLIFGVSLRNAPANNIAGLQISSITLNSNTYTLSGSALTITNGITDNTGSNTISIPLTLGASQTFQNTAAGTTNTISGTIALGPNALTVGGAGNVFLNGAISSTDTNGTAIVNINSSGIVRFGVAGTTVNSFGINAPDAVKINSGTLQILGTGIPNGVTVGNLLDNGTLDLNGQSPTINGLEGAGIVDNLTATLTGVYTLNVGNGDSNAVFSGTIQNTAGSVALNKVGFGTQTLNGNNTYSGLTTINQGTLKVGAAGSLGLNSKSMIISPGGVLDVTALGVLGYLPQNIFNLNAGTPTKPYTNFFGSYNTNYAVFIITTNITATTTNMVTNSIVSVINSDVNGSFNLFGGSFTPVAPSPGYATFTVNGNLTLDNSLGKPNALNFLLNNITNAGGGVNDLIVVTNGTLNIGDTVNFVISPAVGSLASGKYTLIQSTNLVLTGGDFNSSGPAIMNVIAPRGITGTIDTSSQPGNVLLTASGTATPGSIVWAGTNAATGDWDIDLTQNWKNGGSPDFFFSGDNVTFNDTGFGTVNLPNPVTPGSTTFNNNTVNYAFARSTGAFISGNGGLTLNGSGTVTLNNPNSFTGDTTINNGGTLIMGSYGGFGNVNIYNGVPRGQLIFGSGNNTVANAQNLPDTSQSTSFAGFTLNSGANARIMTIENRGSNDGGYMSFGPNINRSVGSSLYITFTLRGGNVNSGVYFTNTMPWTNGLLLAGWAHTGTDWLQAETNFGGASPANGLLNYTGYSNNTALATWQPTNNMSVSGTTFALTASAAINTLKLTGPATVNISSGQILTNQTGGLLVSSASTGPSVITGGTIKGAVGADLIVLQNLPGSGNELTIGSVIADNGSATALTLGGVGGTVILTNNNTYSGATYINAGALQVGAGTALGSIASSSSIIDNGTLSFNRPDSTSVGAVSGLGGVTQLGTGTLTLTANNTFQGLVTISAGILQVGNGGAAGGISNAVGVVNNGTLAFNTSGTVGYPKVISGIGSVVQQGSSTLIVGTNETYTGATIISSGTLSLTAAGSISNTAAIVVNGTFDASAVGGLTLRSSAPSEILAGSGKVIGAVTTAAGTKTTPGTNGVVGTLTAQNNLNLSGGNYFFDIANTNHDKILVGGVLSQNSGTVSLNIIGPALTNGLYQLIYATNGITGGATNLSLAGFGQFGQLAFLTNATANELDLLIITGVNPTVLWKGDGTANLWDATASSIWRDTNNVVALFVNGDITIFDDFGSNTPPVNINAIVQPGLLTANLTNENYTFGVNGGSGANKITGGTSLVKNGPGTLTLQTVNDYVGATVINGGAIQLNGDGGANDDGMIGTGAVTNNATLIVNNVNTETIAGNISGTGLLQKQGVGMLILSGDNTAYSGPITLSNLLQVGNGASGTLGTGTVTNNGTVVLNLNSPNSVVVNANITGSGSVTNTGSGTATLSGTDTYAGNTAIPVGTLKLGSAGALPTTTSVILSTGTNVAGALDLNGFSPTIASLSGNANASGQASFTASQIYNNGSGTSTITINSPTTNTFFGIIKDHLSGTGVVALMVRDGSFLTLNATTNNTAAGAQANTFSGGTTISNASVTFGVNNNNATPGTAGTLAAGTGGVTLLGTNAILLAAGATGSGNPTIATSIGTLTVPAGQIGIVIGPQRGTFTATLQGAGQLTYLVPNVQRTIIAGNWSAFTGTVIFGALTAGQVIPFTDSSGLPLASVVFKTNASAVVYFSSRTAGTIFPMGSLSGGDNNSALSGTAHANGDGGLNTIYAIGGLNSNTVFGGIVTDASGIRKVGTGSLTLTNTDMSYTGQTVVSNGILAFAPSITLLTSNAQTATYLVASNYTLVAPGVMDVSAAGGTLYLGHLSAATIYGNGTLNGSLVVSNGSQVIPGLRVSQAGYFTGSNLKVTNTVTLLGGSTNIMSINRTNAVTSGITNDSLTAVSIAYAGTLIVTNTGDTAFPDGTTNVFQLFKGAISGTFTNIILPAIPTNEIWVTNLTVNGSISLINTNIAVTINPNPPVVSTTFDGTQLTLGWPTNLGWILQSQTNPLSLGLTSNNWFDVAGSATQTNAVITINPTNPGVFFRLRLPP